MADYILDVVNQTSKLDWAFPFQRTSSFPLDRSSLFTSLADATAYASGVANDERKLGGTSYVGQPISVYDADTNSVTLYIIDTDRSLKEVGSSSLGDNLSIEVVDGKIQLKDFGIGYYAYVPGEDGAAGEYVYTEGFKAGLEPRVHLDGENFAIAWYEPNADTGEGAAAAIEALTERVETVEGNINTQSQEIESVKESLGTKANAADVFTKEETNSRIKEEIDKLDHLKRTVVAGVESIDLTKDDADQYIYMVPNVETGNYDEYMVIKNEDGTAELEKVGDWTVNLDGYATTEDLEGKVDKTEGSRLMLESEGEKLASIEEGAEKNYITSVSDELAVDEDGKLSVVKIAQNKVTGLASALLALQTTIDSKVDQEAGSRLITNEEATRLANIKDLIQTVNSTHFSVDDGELNLKDIAISKISGLQDILNGKVTQVYSEVNGEQVPWTLLSPEDQAKLNALVLGDGGNVEISGKVNASNVEGLGSWITNNRETVTGLISSQQESKLDSIQDNAERNYIASVDTNSFAVNDRHLELVNVEMEVVNGLEAALNAKATQASVTTLNNKFTTLETTLNTRMDSVENRMSEVEARLTWQRV